MNSDEILKVKELLYDKSIEEVISAIPHINNKETLYVFVYNYNWDNGFDIPQEILNNEQCDLSIALLVFYRAGGFEYLSGKTDNENLPQWSGFIKRLYDSIISKRYPKGEIEFRVPLSKVQLYKLKKIITEEESVFIQNIDGKCLDADL
ncbi:DUF4274 domain-containing protein [Butyrivibrio sp. XPD2006]|uniref:DUF4274 domain-containing protein n=1 Tax=Butyrivibrio sp. XPD2006 TaxID=1280668 RepID=UPI0003B652DE|nr:DUF4274 domain-containing protein [Butyrivibrio sp. XPD2006]